MDDVARPGHAGQGRIMTITRVPVERAFFAPAGADQLFGILTEPTSEPLGAGVVVLAGGRYEQTAGRNRIGHRLAHALAGEGLHVARIDYHGTGDSTGTHDVFVLHHPFTDDLAAAVAQLRAAGVSRIGVIGDCFGARTALAGAGTIEGIAALLLVSLPWRDLARTNRKAHIQSSKLSAGDFARKGLSRSVLAKLGDPAARQAYRKLAVTKVGHMTRRAVDAVSGVDVEPWVSRRVMRQMAFVRRQRIPTLLLYGSGPGEEYSHDFEVLRRSSSLSWLGARGEPVEVQVLDQPVAGFRNIVSQEEVLAVARRWFPSVLGVATEVA
jgi:alpha-beta hydrolase superfamily lysophospholipase